MTVIAAMQRTLLTILATRELLTLAIVSVIFYAFYYPAPYQQQTSHNLGLVVVDADQSVVSQKFVQHLNDTRAVYIVLETQDAALARELVRERKADGVLYFAPKFGDQLLQGRGGAGIAVWLNASYLVRAESIGTTLADVAQDTVEDIADTVPALARARVPTVLTQPKFTIGGYRDYVFPAVANIILQQTLLSASARFVADRRRRGWTRLTREEALGMLAAFATVGLLACGFYFGFVYWIQDVPHGGNMPGLLISMPLFAIAVAALGLLAGTFFRDGDNALKVLLPTSLPLVFLGGFAWPLAQMPAWLSTLAWLSPATGAMHLFIRFNQMGASLAEARGPLLCMAGLALGYTAAFLLRVEQLNRRPVITAPPDHGAPVGQAKA